MKSCPAQPPRAVARYFLERADGDGVRDATSMKLIKLAYIAHGWVLAFTERPLLSHPVQAWRYGPVVPSLYREFKRFGDQPVPSDQVDLLPPLSLPDDEEGETTRAVLDGVWQSYKGRDGVALSALTHQRGTPWYQTWFGGGGKDRRGVIIPDPLIRDYYCRRMRDSEEVAGAGV